MCFLEEGLMPRVEIDSMMYEFSVLIEEFREAGKYLFSVMDSLEDKYLYRCPKDLRKICAAQHLGHIFWSIKEIGKKAELAFSFRLDIYDEVFADTTMQAISTEIPCRDELYSYCHEVFDAFFEELKHFRSAELAYYLINHHYKHIHEIVRLFSEYGYEIEPPQSSRLIRKEVNGSYLYTLPLYAN